jgi:hypothetical protein
VFDFGASNTARNDLSSFRKIFLEKLQVLVIDQLAFIG